MRSTFIWMLGGLLLLASQAGARANYTGYSGSPGRQTCANSCHGGSNGTVTVTGFPELYTPGTPYTITVTKTSGSNIRNFNGSCRLGSGSSNAGQLSGGTGTSTYNVNGESNGIHCSSGNLSTCTFSWTAPAAGSGSARLYIAAYQGSGANGQTTALNLTAQEGSSGEPQLAISDVQVLSDDDNDGLAEGGETVTLSLRVQNTGTARASNISGVVNTSSMWAQFIDVASEWPNIPAGQSALNTTPFSLVVNPALSQDENVNLALLLTSDEGTFNLEGMLQVHWEMPDPLDLGAQDAVILSDSDSDGVLEPGEDATFSVTLLNYGNQSLSEVTATLATMGPWLTALDSLSSFPNLPPQGSGDAITPFRVHLSAAAPALYEEFLVLQVMSSQGPGSAVFTLPVGIRQEVFTADMENGAEGWIHSAAAGWNDDWHLAEAGSGSPTHAWKCGAVGDGTYSNHQDARLESPELTLLPWSRLEFQHSMSAEVSGAYPDSAYDGGIVELSLDGGSSWEQLNPVYDYGHTFRYLTGSGNPTTHPFGGGVRGYSGTMGWETVTFDLTAYGAVPVRFRFRFGSDDGTGLGGWLIDDVRVYGLYQDTGLGSPAERPGALTLAPAQPNPFNPTTQVVWEMNQAGTARLDLYNLRGERVRQLAQGEFAAGRHELRLDAAGLATGTYFLRAEALGESRVQKLLLLK